jgi:ornithine--oxo-acid transaminase
MSGTPLSSEKCIDLEARYGARNYKPIPIVISRGEGCWVWDPEGNKYLDCLAAYSALNQGYGHPRILAAAREQLETGVTLTSRAFYNSRLGEFVEKITKLSGFEKALPMCTGAEAVETAIKMARKHAYTRRGVAEDQAEILVFEGNFHGRTTTIVGFSSEEQYRRGFGPFTPGFRILPYGDLDAVRAAAGPSTAAILVEPIQGEGGIIVPPDGFLAGLETICRETGALLILDEIQSGLGRSGTLFAYEHEGIRPDAVLLAKALTGGMYPLSVVLADEEAMGVFEPGDHGSTYGGAPYGAAVAIAALDALIEEKLPERAVELGEHAFAKIREIDSPHVAEIRGRGLWIGIEVKKESGPARPFCEALLKEGVLSKETHEQVIRLAPPLVITRDEIDWMIERLKKVLV